MPSTAICRITYDPGDRDLWVTFASGRQYVYFDVPPEKFSAFSHAGSRGSFFNREIRDHCGYREILAPHQQAS